jgi:hypothetical protein
MNGASRNNSANNFSHPLAPGYPGVGIVPNTWAPTPNNSPRMQYADLSLHNQGMAHEIEPIERQAVDNRVSAWVSRTSHALHRRARLPNNSAPAPRRSSNIPYLGEDNHGPMNSYPSERHRANPTGLRPSVYQRMATPSNLGVNGQDALNSETVLNNSGDDMDIDGIIVQPGSL